MELAWALFPWIFLLLMTIIISVVGIAAIISLFFMPTTDRDDPGPH